MTDLRRALDRAATGFRSGPGTLDHVFERVGARQRRRRITAAGVGLVIGLAAIAIPVTAFRNSDTAPPSTESPSPAVSTALGTNGSVLWPARTVEELAELQAAADLRPRSEYLDPMKTSASFAERVLGWTEPYKLEFVDQSEFGDGRAEVRLSTYSAPCSPNEDGLVDPGCYGAVVTLDLVQPLEIGREGIWVVAAVRSPTASIDAVPGQVLRNGDSIAARLDVSDGLYPIAGFVLGTFGSSDPRHCEIAMDSHPGTTDVSIQVHIEPDVSAGTDCGSGVHGYVWVATASWKTGSGQSLGDPLLGDSSPYVSVAAVPIFVSIPENSPGPGLTTYVDERGWRVDHPASWFVTPLPDDSTRLNRDGITISNTEVPDLSADTVMLTVSHTAGGRAPDLLTDDSSFPLSLEDFDVMPSDRDRSVVSFRGNGVAYSAGLSIGGQATEGDVEAMNDVIRSLRFRSLGFGQISNGWMSLGPLARFKQERGTSWYAGGRLGVIYVMRGTRGTYVLDLEPESCGEGQHQTWDPSTLQLWIQCPDGGDVRYERDGIPLASNPPGYLRPLVSHPAITAWDGSLLVNVDARIGGLADLNWP